MISSQIYQTVVDDIFWPEMIDGGYQTLGFFGTLIQKTPARSDNQPRSSERSSRRRHLGINWIKPSTPLDILDQPLLSHISSM